MYFHCKWQIILVLGIVLTQKMCIFIPPLPSPLHSILQSSPTLVSREKKYQLSPRERGWWLSVTLHSLLKQIWIFFIFFYLLGWEWLVSKEAIPACYKQILKGKKEVTGFFFKWPWNYQIKLYKVQTSRVVDTCIKGMNQKRQSRASLNFCFCKKIQSTECQTSKINRLMPCLHETYLPEVN